MTTIDDVTATFGKWLYLPDPGVVHVALGTIAANLLAGDPVWLLVVGPPGSGKSEVLQSTAGLSFVHPAATLTEAALLSGTPQRETAKDAKGGLLRSIGDFGVILAKDFGSVLSMHREARGAVLAALREVYDGSWSRHVGVDGGKSLVWRGKVGLLAGCTPTIDRHHAVMGAMGERFLLYRPHPGDPAEQARRALSHGERGAEMRAELGAAVEALFADGVPRTPDVLTDEERELLIVLSTLVVVCRSAVEREGQSREIELVPEPEAPTRIAKALERLLAGLSAIGVQRDQAWRLVVKVGFDCVPALRLAIIDVLAASGERPTTVIAEAVRHPTTTTRRALEDLAAHGVCVRRGHGRGHADTWQLSEWAVKRLREVRPNAGGVRVATVPETSDGLFGGLEVGP